MLTDRVNALQVGVSRNARIGEESREWGGWPILHPHGCIFVGHMEIWGGITAPCSPEHLCGHKKQGGPNAHWSCPIPPGYLSYRPLLDYYPHQMLEETEAQTG